MDLRGACRDLARALLIARGLAFRAAGIVPSSLHVPRAEIVVFVSDEAANLAPPDSAMQDVEDARVRLERAIEESRLVVPPPPLSRLGPALGLDPDEVLLVAVLHAIETTPILREVARSCAGDPIESGLTPLFLSETVAALDRARTRAMLRALGPGDALRRHLVVESGRPDSIGLRDPVHLESSLSAWLSDEVVLSSDSRLVKTRDDVDHGYWDASAVTRAREALGLAARRSSRGFRCLFVSPDAVATRRLLAAILADAGQSLLAGPPASSIGSGAASDAGVRTLTLALRDARLLDAVALIEDPETWLGRPEAMARLQAHRGPVMFVSRSPVPDLLLYFPELVEVSLPPVSAESRERYLAGLLADVADGAAIARRIG